VSTKQLMTVAVNGAPRSVPRGQTLRELLDALGIIGDRVAVELDGRIVKPKDWAGTAIPEGGQVEIVHFVGGG
jgi:thiamine biosynthesis protein ThiS